MTVDDYIATNRSRLDDETTTYLWSNADLISYTNRRINEFSRETNYFRDNTTAAICSIAVTAGTKSYALDSRVLEVVRVLGSWDADKKPLARKSVTYMDSKYPSWEDDDPDDPLYYITDRTNGYITLHPTPLTSGTLSLDVIRLPLAQLTTADISKTPTAATLDFPLMWIDNLIDGVLASAFAKPDSQTRNPKMEQYHLGLWNQFLSDAKNYLINTRFSGVNPPDTL